MGGGKLESCCIPTGSNARRISSVYQEVSCLEKCDFLGFSHSPVWLFYSSQAGTDRTQGHENEFVYLKLFILAC